MTTRRVATKNPRALHLAALTDFADTLKIAIRWDFPRLIGANVSFAIQETMIVLGFSSHAAGVLKVGVLSLHMSGSYAIRAAEEPTQRMFLF